MPTTKYVEENLAFFPSQQGIPEWQQQYFPETIYRPATFPSGSGASHGSSSESEFSAPENFIESSNSPLRSPDTTTPDFTGRGRPFLQFVEPPIESCRFRYPTEMKGTHGPITGISTLNKQNARKKIYPSVKLCNYNPAPNEKVIIRCTLYTADEEEKDRIPHVHQLKGKEKNSSCQSVEIDDPIDIVVSSPYYQAIFSNLTILFIKKGDQLKELVKKKTRHILRKCTNPNISSERVFDNTDIKELKTAAQKEISRMNLNKLNTACLKFEALRVSCGRTMYEPIPYCQPLFSNPIKNSKSSQFNDLRICRLDKVAGSCLGREEVFIFVEKVNRKDIKVRFFELNEDGEEVWDAYAEFCEDDVHYQYAIAFRTPRYRNVEINENVKVYFQLERQSNKSRSEPREFDYTPDSRRWQESVRKRRRQESPPIPLTVSDLSRPTSSNASTWSFGPGCNEFCQTDPISTVAVPSGSSSTITSTNTTWSDLNDLFKEFDFQTLEAMDALNEEDEQINNTQQSDSFLSGALSNVSSVDSEVLYQFINTRGAVELWAGYNRVSNDMVQELKSQVSHMCFDDLVTDGATSRNVGKPEMAVAEHQGGLDILTRGHKGVVTQAQPHKRNRDKLTKYNIISKVDKVLNGLSELNKNGKIAENNMKQYFLRLFTTCVGDQGDCVLHILAGNENFSYELLKFLQILQIYNIAETVVNLKNSQEQTPLHIAAVKGSLQTIALLVEYTDFNSRDSNQDTAIHLLAKRLQNEDTFHAVGHILEKNPDLTTYNKDGLTALHMFVMNRRSDIVSSLIIKQENENSSIDIINQRDRKQGNTPLHIAVQKRFKEIVTLLLNFDNRIDVNVKNFESKTPLAYVCGESDPDSLFIKELLLANNADPALVENKMLKEVKEVDELKDEIDNSNSDFEDDNIDESLPSYAQDWKSGAETKLLDAKTVCSVCPVLDENKNWERLLKKLNFDEDIHAFLELKWSPSLYLLKSIAEAMPHMTSELLRDTLIKINPECKKAAQFIDDMIMYNMGVF